MRSLFLAALLVITFSAGAQTLGSSASRTRLHDVKLSDSTVNKKWFFSMYTTLAAGFVAFNGGSASYVAAPMGLRLNRMLNNNTYAFAGVEIAPAYINFNQRFMNADLSKGGFSNSFLARNPGNFTINPAAYIGVGYTNDARTFSIEGRFGVQSSNANYFTDPTGFRDFRNLGGQMTSPFADKF